ncbi:MAG: helix-turn-helix transcriptional regulator [Saprospiraceae bacterium]|nr:helix-turn-helix transcriptional regulator [Saprospiraceae bacterium]
MRKTVRLHFGLVGDYRFKYSQLNRSFDLPGGHHNIMYSKGIDLLIENKTDTIETLGVKFPPAVFLELVRDERLPWQNFSAAIAQGKGALISNTWGSISISIQQIIDQILRNPYHDRMEQIYVQAKTLELLVLCLNDYRNKSKQSYKYLHSKSQKEKVVAARDYLNQNLTDPPSLREVARAVGMNEFKLKYGFKEMFGSTLFGYLRERRLELAKQELISTDKNIMTIALDLGCASPQHFHTQFKKRYGEK